LVPELPEVEVLVRHLHPLLVGRTVRGVHVSRPKVAAPTPVGVLQQALKGSTFTRITRRGKYLLFECRRGRRRGRVKVVGHLGMTGRMYLQSAGSPLPKHASVVLNCGAENFVFEDTRYFGRFTLDSRALTNLGPEPLSSEFTSDYFSGALARSVQPIKIKLLAQRVVAGVGNIYASEALFRAGIYPTAPARNLTRQEIQRLWCAIRRVLREAIARGSTVPLDFQGAGKRDGLFYYGSTNSTPTGYEERLAVYDRAGSPCLKCGTHIKRFVQGARSTFFCPKCQPRRRKRGEGRGKRAATNGRRKMGERRRTG
jgi:formamidopyrimidine-DNA glycosylase